jgi:hypothetical protein
MATAGRRSLLADVLRWVQHASAAVAPIEKRAGSKIGSADLKDKLPFEGKGLGFGQVLGDANRWERLAGFDKGRYLSVAPAPEAVVGLSRSQTSNIIVGRFGVSRAVFSASWSSRAPRKGPVPGGKSMIGCHRGVAGISGRRE